MAIAADEDPLLRLFRNFLTNAVRYTNHGEVCCSAKAGGDLVEFVIADTGIGISAFGGPRSQGSTG